MPSMRQRRASRRAANEAILRKLREEEPSPRPGIIAVAILATLLFRIAMHVGKP